ncbi:MAG: hypothetical protein AB7U83_12890 [Vicinamibacterales bacterium]
MTPRWRSTGLATVALLAVAVGGAGQPADDTRLVDAHRVAAQIETLLGPADRNCGIFLLEAGRPVSSTDDFWKPAATRRQMRDALRCVRDARRNGQAATAVWQVPGFDASAFGGVATSAVSDLQVVQAGSRSATDGVQLMPCLRPRVDDAGEIVCRNTPRPLSGRDLERVLSRLRRDVEQTAGEAQAGHVARVFGAPLEAGGDSAPELEPARFAALAADVQRVVQQDRAGWPACPRHHDHPLEPRDQHWYCSRDRVFVAEIGGLARSGVPRVGR